MTGAAVCLAALSAVVGQVATLQVGPEVARLGPGGLYDLDLPATAKALYADHPDIYDVLVLWPDFPTTADAGALYQPVANSTLGINFDQGGAYPEEYDRSAEYGSDGALQGVIVVGSLSELSDAELLDVVAQETAHQFAAMVSFVRSPGGRPHSGLLGVAGTHWSFFVDSGGSVLGGNRFVGASDGRWRTEAPGGAYAPFDLYLMGLMAAEDVPPMRWMPSPTIVDPRLDPRGRSWSATSPATAGVVLEGAWEEVSVAQVVAAEGERGPAGSGSAGRSSGEFRQAWAIVVRKGEEASEGRRAQVERAYEGFPGHFAALTGGRGEAIVGLDGVRGGGGEGAGCACGPGSWDRGAAWSWGIRR